VGHYTDQMGYISWVDLRVSLAWWIPRGCVDSCRNQVDLLHCQQVRSNASLLWDWWLEQSWVLEAWVSVWRITIIHYLYSAGTLGSEDAELLRSCIVSSGRKLIPHWATSNSLLMPFTSCANSKSSLRSSYVPSIYDWYGHPTHWVHWNELSL